MKTRTIIVVGCWVGWVSILVLIARVNMIGFSSTNLRWNNPRQPNATFRWATTSADVDQRIVTDTPRAVKVTVPRSFTSGTLVVNTVDGPGRLLVSINAPIGQTMSLGSGQTGQPITVPLSLASLAMSNRTFTVQLTAEDAPVTVRQITLSLTRL